MINKDTDKDKGWYGEEKRHRDAAEKGLTKKRLESTSRVTMERGTEVTEIMDTHFVITNPDWVAGLEIKMVKLAAIAEILDYNDIDSSLIPTWGDEEYPIVVEVAIMVHPDDMSPDYIDTILSGSGLGEQDRKDYKKDRPLSLLFDAYSYSGGVSVNMETVAGGEISKAETLVRKEPSRFGSMIKSRYFKDFDNAEDYIRNVYAHNLQVVMMMVGFYLDKPVNLVGTTGWDIIEQQALGKEWM